MRRWAQLGMVALAVVAVASAVSHSLVGWLGFRKSVVKHRVIGEWKTEPRAYLAGSSLLRDGLALERVSQGLRCDMETWFVPSSSPAEWEPFQLRAPGAKLTLFSVSGFDLNEDYLCDVHSDVVTLRDTARDLASVHASWPFTKRVISQYPLKYLRLVFPTAGQSLGVMGGIKERLRRLSQRRTRLEAAAGPAVPMVDGEPVEPPKRVRISEWPAGTLLRQLAKMRTACQGRHSYAGVRKLAFLRMLQRARGQGRVIVVVLPVSPAYQKEFLPDDKQQQFEALLAEAQRAAPDVLWVRLDQIPELNSNDNFSDVVHMNIFGQQIATDALLQRMREALPGL